MTWFSDILFSFLQVSGSEGCGFNSHQCLALLSFSKTSYFYPHCCSPPLHVYINGDPIGCERYLLLNLAYVRPWSGAWPECSPGSWEGAQWVQVRYWIQWPGVIIHCRALWLVSHTRKALYKNQLLLLLLWLLLLVSIVYLYRICAIWNYRLTLLLLSSTHELSPYGVGLDPDPCPP